MLIKFYRLKAKFIFSCLIFFLFFLIFRIYYIQFISKDIFQIKANAQHQANSVLNPIRGSIFDANGIPLAVTVNVYTLKVVPHEIQNVNDFCSILSENIQISSKNILKKVSRKKRKCVYLKRKISEHEYKKIKQLNLKGVYFDKETKRIYPKGNLASHVLGFVGMDPIGLEGIERYYNEELSGTEGYSQYIKDARAQKILGLNDKKLDKRDGYNLYLSIDESIQYIVEREIAFVYEKYKPLSINAVVMEPKTGYVLGLANLPCYDSNKITNDLSNMRNRVVTDVYEPGSTFKIVALSGALNDSIIVPEDKIYCEKGSFRVKGRVKPLHDHKPHGWLTVSKVLQKSSNIGTAKIAMKLGQERFYHYIRGFGFGRKTRIDLPGEQKGFLRKVKAWTSGSMAAIPMGQEIGCTVLQMLYAMGAIANKGVLMKPKIVRRIDTKSGIVIREFMPEINRRVISKDTAKIMTKILTGVVSTHGTARRAVVGKYKVAGKTGTSQKFDFKQNKYSHKKFIASFVGFLPANDPKLCIIVTVDEPPYNVRYGGVIAAPVFSKIASDAMLYLQTKKL